MTQSNANNVVQLDIRGLHCRPAGRPALRGVNLAIARGTFLAVIGANGSGKGTLCRCLARLFREEQGHILLNGRELPNRTEDLPAVGMVVVMQGTRVFPEMSVSDNLLCSPPTWRNNKRRERLDEVLQLLPHLKERLRQTGGTLSGGEQQMVALGRALMATPSLLVIEEPSLGLAETTTEEVYGILACISSEGRTVVVTEETSAVAARFATQIRDMAQGVISGSWRAQVIPDQGSTVISASQ